MIGLALLLLAPAGPTADLARGAQVFAESCAVGYCHGKEGAANRGPRLRDRNFDAAYVMRVTRDGIAGTAMPGWKTRLPATDLDAVVAYVLSLSGGGEVPGLSRPATSESPAAKPIATHPGKLLFFDATRIQRCGTCHELDGRGVAVGPDLAKLGARSASDWLKAMRSPTTRSVESVALKNGARFPGRAASEGKQDRFYDLSGPLPVLRTIPPGQNAVITPGNWRHESVVSKYTEAELKEIAAFLAHR